MYEMHEALLKERRGSSPVCKQFKQLCFKHMKGYLGISTFCMMNYSTSRNLKSKRVGGRLIVVCC